MGLLDNDPFARPEPPAVVAPDPLVAVLAALDQLRSAITSMPAPPAPIVSVAAPDLSEIVQAVTDLKGPASADEIAAALRDVLVPRDAQTDPAVGGALAEVAAALKKLDFRLQGVGTQAYGGGAVDLSAQTIQQLSDGITINANLAGVATETTLQSINNGVKQPQILDASNSATRTAANGATQWSGAYSLTRPLGVVRGTTVIASNVASGLGGTFEFIFSEDGIVPNGIDETRTILSFSSVRDFDLKNFGKYFLAKFTPSRALVGSEAVFIATQFDTQYSGPFVRLANQQIEEANAAMGEIFSFNKAFDRRTGLSVNVRANEVGALDVNNPGEIISASGSLSVTGDRDDITLDFSTTSYAASILKIAAAATQVGSFSQDATEGRIVFATGAGANRLCYYQSTQQSIYESDHEITGDQSFYVPALTGTAEFRSGYMVDDGAGNILHGLGWGLDATGAFLWRMKNGVDQIGKLRQASFNRDRLDGAEPSRFRRNGLPVAYQPTMNSWFRETYAWLGISPPSWGIQTPEKPIIDAHIDETSNSQTGTTLPTPTLKLGVRMFTGSMAAGFTAASGSWHGGTKTSKTILTGRKSDGSFGEVALGDDSSLNVGGTPATVRFEYDSNRRLIYFGKASPGASDSSLVSTSWTVFKLAYTSTNDEPDNLKIAERSAWANRTTLTYL